MTFQNLEAPTPDLNDTLLAIVYPPDVKGLLQTLLNSHFPYAALVITLDPIDTIVWQRLPLTLYSRIYSVILPSGNNGKVFNFTS
jgi:hypothetical protein